MTAELLDVEPVPDAPPILEPMRVIELAAAPLGPRSFAKAAGVHWAVTLTYAQGWLLREQSTDYTDGEGVRPKLPIYERTESVAVRLRHDEDALRGVAHWTRRPGGSWSNDEAWWWLIDPDSVGQPVERAEQLPQPVGLTELKAVIGAEGGMVTLGLALVAHTAAHRAKQAAKVKRSAVAAAALAADLAPAAPRVVTPVDFGRTPSWWSR
jgi:hypothetical protein